MPICISSFLVKDNINIYHFWRGYIGLETDFWRKSWKIKSSNLLITSSANLQRTEKLR
nr:MAG TPA: hypothetical protein [Caudoviricetes sp.]